MNDSELIAIEQALRLSRHVVQRQAHSPYTLGKVEAAIRIIQAVPHSTECDCDYCAERKEKANY